MFISKNKIKNKFLNKFFLRKNIVFIFFFTIFLSLNLNFTFSQTTSTTSSTSTANKNIPDFASVLENENPFLINSNFNLSSNTFNSNKYARVKFQTLDISSTTKIFNVDKRAKFTTIKVLKGISSNRLQDYYNQTLPEGYVIKRYTVPEDMDVIVNKDGQKFYPVLYYKNAPIISSTTAITIASSSIGNYGFRLKVSDIVGINKLSYKLYLNNTILENNLIASSDYFSDSHCNWSICIGEIGGQKGELIGDNTYRIEIYGANTFYDADKNFYIGSSTIEIESQKPSMKVFDKNSLSLTKDYFNPTAALINFNDKCVLDEKLQNQCDNKFKWTYFATEKDGKFATTSIFFDGSKNFLIDGLKENIEYNLRLYAVNEISTSTSYLPFKFTLQNPNKILEKKIDENVSTSTTSNSFIDLSLKSENVQVKNTIGFYLSNITSNSIQLNWNDFKKTKEETTLNLEYSTKNLDAGTLSYNSLNIEKKQSCYSGICKYVVNDLSPNTAYIFKMNTSGFVSSSENVLTEKIFKELGSFVGTTLSQ